MSPGCGGAVIEAGLWWCGDRTQAVAVIVGQEAHWELVQATGTLLTIDLRYESLILMK